MTSVAS